MSLTRRSSTDNDSMSGTFSNLLPPTGTNGGVGLADPATASQRRGMLDLINRLRNIGVQRDIDLPMIAVIGNQSAGKSSLIESISGVTLPRCQGTYTPWTCVVKLHFITDERDPPTKATVLTFGDATSNKTHVEERTRRAQLRSSVGWKQNIFSRHYVSLEISGRELADLSFVDLPGLIAGVGHAGNAKDVELVRNLVISYIEKPNCLILLTVACETDFENQGAHHLARQYDPSGKRTAGVLTKPDRIPPGEEESWIRLIRNQVEHLDNNWYCVKKPSSRDISLGINWMEARSSGLDSHLHQFLGTGRLTERLSAILSELIARRLPEIRDELQVIILQARSDLEELPPAPSNNPVGEIHRLLKGTPDENGLVQTIRLHSEAFKREIYSTAPNFLPWEQKDSHRRLHLLPAWFLSNEENVDTQDEDDDDDLGLTQPVALRGNAIYIDERFVNIPNGGRTRELPDYYPFVVQADYVSTIVKKWQEPAVELFEVVNSIIRERVGKLVEEHFAHLGRGGVMQAVLMIVHDHLDEAAARAKQKIDWLLQIEGTPATINTHYYTDYRDKCRETNHNTVSNIRRLAADCNKVETVNKALSSLNELGISAKADDLTRLLPADPLEVALGIMASVRGYFQVAYKRFVDMVPLAIDYEMVRGLERGLNQALLEGLHITGKDAHERCAAMLQEPAATASRRRELSKKLERLRVARTELKRLSV
ncbi:P-loop containing nucleoside triphosphate hydrolase protein [Pisolithus thermaeus]|nr:P-loop containing nucleoside triphosphate hydrolase protein [Pisolithus thermaeus]